MALVVVEREFADPVDIYAYSAVRKDGAWCFERHRVRYLRTYFSTDCRRMICLYEAPDAESVRQVSRQLGIPFARAWTATAFERPPGSDVHVPLRERGDGG